MTNKENQKRRNKEKWEQSEFAGEDLSGQMVWCDGCPFSISGEWCGALQEQRDNECLCAKNYNRIARRRR